MLKSLRHAVLLAALPLAACASYERLDSGLNTLVGQDREVAIARLGFPDEQREIAGKDVFIWETGFRWYDRGGYYGGCSQRYGGIRSMSCVGFAPSIASNHCQVRVIAEKSGKITDVDRQGDVGACQTFANRLQAGVPISGAAPQ